MMTDIQAGSINLNDFSKICRICLHSTNLTNETISKFYTVFPDCNTEANSDEKLPQNICQMCVKELEIIRDFISKFERSTTVLISILLTLKLDVKPESNNIIEPVYSDSDNNVIEDTEDIISKDKSECTKSRKRLGHESCSEKKKMYLCNVCGKYLTRRSTLKDHLRMHSGEKNFSCQLCGFKFTIKRNLTRHLAVHESEKKFHCNICGKGLTQKNYLEKHIQSFHRETKIKVKKDRKPTCFCPICGRGFAFANYLERHKVTHTGHKPKEKKEDAEHKEFLCTHCGKQFTSKCNLERHILITHSGEKRYECKICGNKYTIKSSLDYHMNIHEGLKPFQCHICTKSFRQPSALRKHILVHTGERKFKCHICEKAFKTSTHLKTHFKIHAWSS